MVKLDKEKSRFFIFSFSILHILRNNRFTFVEFRQSTY